MEEKTKKKKKKKEEAELRRVGGGKPAIIHRSSFTVLTVLCLSLPLAYLSPSLASFLSSFYFPVLHKNWLPRHSGTDPGGQSRPPWAQLHH